LEGKDYEIVKGVICRGSRLKHAGINSLRSTGKGYGGDIKIELVVSGGKITDLKAVEHKETAGIADGAFEGIKEQLIEKQSAEGLEIVTGATSTSNGLIEAVNVALPKAQQ
jgi:fumarate reductase flavoprotein subunit